MLISQVNRMFRNRIGLNCFRRFAHTQQPALQLLESRKLLKVSGDEVSVFLQGLITNDMRHFEEGSKSMYTIFLNTKGRVLYDTLLYKWDDTSYLIDCDKDVINLLQKHLKIYKLRRKINVEDINEKFRLWSLISAADNVNVSNVDPKNEINLYKDPRLHDLGFRIVASSSLDGDKVAKSIGSNVETKSNDEEYTLLRYKLGVSEGSKDHPPGTCFPLEVNCDFLHGVSFHKGCYIGQEVTARTHHTGVVRKRIMPLKFADEIKDLDKDAVISDPNKPKTNLGKFKGILRNCGIGLVRVKEALEANSLNIGPYSVKVIKPSWWPVEAQKEKVNAAKTE